MQKKDIQTWLSSRDHDWKEGLALFVAFSNNKNMLRVLLSHSETVRSKNMLKYELKKIIRTSTSVSGKKKNHISQKLSIDSQTRKTINPILKTPNILLWPATGEQSANPVIKPLMDQIKSLFVEAASIFYQLHHLPKKECELACLRILDLSDDRDRLWFQVDYFKKYGVLPSSADVTSQSVLKDKLHNLRTYISKHREHVKNARTVETREKYQLKLDQMILQRDDLEFKLSSGGTIH